MLCNYSFKCVQWRRRFSNPSSSQSAGTLSTPRPKYTRPFRGTLWATHSAPCATPEFARVPQRALCFALRVPCNRCVFDCLYVYFVTCAHAYQGPRSWPGTRVTRSATLSNVLQSLMSFYAMLHSGWRREKYRSLLIFVGGAELLNWRRVLLVIIFLYFGLDVMTINFTARPGIQDNIYVWGKQVTYRFARPLWSRGLMSKAFSIRTIRAAPPYVGNHECFSALLNGKYIYTDADSVVGVNFAILSLRYLNMCRYRSGFAWPSSLQCTRTLSPTRPSDTRRCRRTPRTPGPAPALFLGFHMALLPSRPLEPVCMCRWKRGLPVRRHFRATSRPLAPVQLLGYMFYQQ